MKPGDFILTNYCQEQDDAWHIAKILDKKKQHYDFVIATVSLISSAYMTLYAKVDYTKTNFGGWTAEGRYQIHPLDIKDQRLIHILKHHILHPVLGEEFKAFLRGKIYEEYGIPERVQSDIEFPFKDIISISQVANIEIPDKPKANWYAGYYPRPNGPGLDKLP